MNEVIYVIEDELPGHLEKLEKIQHDMREQGKEKTIAFDQWETFHDNPAWEQVEMEQKMSSVQLQQINRIINESKKLTFAQLEMANPSIVSIGKKVALIIDEEEKSIVVWWYSTPVEWRVSYNAPLVKAILWKQIWEFVEKEINWVLREIEILNIEKIQPKIQI